MPRWVVILVDPHMATEIPTQGGMREKYFCLGGPQKFPQNMHQAIIFHACDISSVFFEPRIGRVRIPTNWSSSWRCSLLYLFGSSEQDMVWYGMVWVRISKIKERSIFYGKYWRTTECNTKIVRFFNAFSQRYRPVTKTIRRLKLRRIEIQYSIFELISLLQYQIRLKNNCYARNHCRGRKMTIK